MEVIRNYRAWRRYRESVRQLSHLSDRDLQDMGLARGDIHAVAQRKL